MEENAISTEIKSKWSGWCFWVQNWFLEQKKKKPKIFKTELIQEIKWFQSIRERDKEKGMDQRKGKVFNLGVESSFWFGPKKTKEK